VFYSLCGTLNTAISINITVHYQHKASFRAPSRTVFDFNVRLPPPPVSNPTITITYLYSRASVIVSMAKSAGAFPKKHTARLPRIVSSLLALRSALLSPLASSQTPQRFGGPASRYHIKRRRSESVEHEAIGRRAFQFRYRQRHHVLWG